LFDFQNASQQMARKKFTDGFANGAPSLSDMRSRLFVLTARVLSVIGVINLDNLAGA
jgi:hypothetical protein